MTSQLRALDSILRDKAPAIRSAFRPGLQALAIRRTLEPLHQHVPDEVVALYEWHDGCEVVSDPERAELFPGAQMLPLQEVMAKRTEGLQADRLHSPTAWKSSWLPVFAGSEWKYWVVDCAQPGVPVITFDWVDLPETSQAYERLSVMLDALVRCWKEGAYRQGPYATVNEDRRAVAQIRREMDGKPVDIDRLISDLSKGDDHQYSQALGWLRTRLYPEAVPNLVRMLDTETRGRIAAVELLSAIGGPVAIAKLREVADKDQDDLVRDFARHALEELG